MSRQRTPASLERIKARCTECGDCWLWDGALCGNARMPSMHHEGKTVAVRRLVYQLKHGSIPAGRAISPSCGRRLCVSPNCLQAVTEKQSKQRWAKLGAYSNPGKQRRMALTKRAKSHISDEMVERVRAATSAPEAARETGVSLSYAKDIRAGRSRRDYSSHFDGLGARSQA
jgi:hypothetical protein